MEPIIFKHENYNIASDIRLEAEVAYIQGQPIAKTKTVVLHYRGSTFKANAYGSSFSDSLIKHIIRPQYTIELINYLSRLINHDNLFEVYAKNINIERYTLEELTFANSENSEQGCATLFDKTEYFKGLIDERNRLFIQSRLTSKINKRFSYIFPSIEELNYVPIYGYISSSSALSRMSEPILHLAVIFNVLAHQDRFSCINNQEAIASFNSIMKAKRLNVTAQNLNEHEYASEIKRLKLELQRERERANGLEIAKKTLEEKLDEMNAKLDTQTQALTQAQAERQQLQNSLNDANAKLDTANATIHNLHDVVVESGQILHAEFQAAKDEFRERFNQLNVTTSSRVETIDVWNIRALDAYYHRTHQCEDNEHVLDTYCGDASKPSRIKQHRFKPQENDELIGSYSNANAIDLAVYLRRHQAEYPHVRMDSNRKLIYSDDELDEVRNLLTAYSQTRETITTVVNKMDERYHDASETLIERLQAALHPVAQAQNQILANQQVQQQQQVIMQAQIQELQQHEQEHHQQQQQAINNLADEVHELKISFIEFRNKKPRCRELLHRSRYRLIAEDEEGNAYCEDTKNGPRYYLTEHDLAHGRFR